MWSECKNSYVELLNETVSYIAPRAQQGFTALCTNDYCCYCRPKTSAKSTGLILLKKKNKKVWARVDAKHVVLKRNKINPRFLPSPLLSKPVVFFNSKYVTRISILEVTTVDVFSLLEEIYPEMFGFRNSKYKSTLGENAPFLHPVR